MSQVDMMELDLDPFSDIVPESAMSNVRAGRKFQPRVNKARPIKAAYEVSAPVLSYAEVHKQSGPASSVSDVGIGIPLPDDNGNSDLANSVITNAVSSGALVGDQHSTLGKSMGDNTDIFSGLESIHDLTTQPKDPDNSSALEVSDPTVSESGTSPETDHQGLRSEEGEAFRKLDANDGPIPTFSPDHVLDYSSLGLGDFIASNDAAADFLGNGEDTNLLGTSHLGDENMHSKDDCAVPEKEISNNSKQKYSLRSSLSSKSKAFGSASKINEGEQSSRQLRKQAAAPRLVDEPEDTACDSADFSAYPPSIPSAEGEEDNDNDDQEYRVEENGNAEPGGGVSPQKKGAPKRPRKCVSGKEKSVRKRKKANESQEKSTKESHKKFSHSTSRRKRRGNMEVLKVPEEEIDYHSLRICDFILLLEHKEKLAAKSAKASEKPSNDQCTEGSFHGQESYNEDGSFASASDRGYTNETDFEQQPTTSLFNSHSFMNRTPVVRWTAQDTELFYEGIRQFGTDLAMIQQLFPGRTRQQIKLKYKKEERLNPFKLSDALSNRSKDYSYFEKVIEQLQKASNADQGPSGDESVALTGGEEAGLNPETNEEVSKPEQETNASVKEPEEDIPENPEADVSKEDGEDEENEMALWSTYKSAF